jgi:uncharacterized protein (DUF58 family)
MNLIPLVLIVLLIAFLTASDGLYYLAYALAGIGVLSRLWTRLVSTGIQVERRFDPHAFHGEQTAVDVLVTNRSRLPLLWLELHESLPLALHIPNFERWVVSLEPGEQTAIRYKLNCNRRGYYQLGPLRTRTGDFLQAARDREGAWPEDRFIVYPRIVPLTHLSIPSQLPFGTLASRERIFEDASRFFGVRDYDPGDSLRMINWKSSAHLDRLQVKRFQPAIALHTTIFLDLNTEAYNIYSRVNASEMGIVVAASLAAYLIERRQQVGLMLLGIDQMTELTGLTAVPPSHGREHLIRLLETLARANLAATTPLPATLPQMSAHLSWGSTAIVITSGEQPGLIPALLQIRRQGLNVLVIATDSMILFDPFQAQLKQIGIPAYRIIRESDMDVWR